MAETAARAASGFEDTNRALRMLSASGLPYALTGSLALNVNLRSLGAPAIDRPLGDLDVVIPSFYAAPASLGRHFLYVHVHPHATGGKTLLQLADPRTRVRIDIFQAVGGTMNRATVARLGKRHVPIVALEDLAARAVRQLLGMERGTPVPRKTAGDLMRMLPYVNTIRAERAWLDHRGSVTDGSFESAAARATRLIEDNAELLITPKYSTDASAVCARCRPHGAFQLAPKQTILDILGYC